VAHPPRCSLNQPTGRNRRLAVARADLAALASAAHARGGTINDALLTAVAGALEAGLRERGESADRSSSRYRCPTGGMPQQRN
jgi:hypothetical protein